MFTHELKAEVKISVSGEEGTIEGRADYTSSQTQYYIRYQAADGRAVESWWNADAIESI